MRLIDANALLDSKWWDSLKDDFDKARAKIVILSAPTVDAVEVVRCKDCMSLSPDELRKAYNAGDFCMRTGLVVHNEDFCSYGERRTDG